MTESTTGKDSLYVTALNDIDACVQEFFSEPFSEEGWEDLNLSIQNAIQLGVSPESALSRLLNSIPEPVRTHVIDKVAKKYDLTDKGIEQIIAPED